MYDFSADDVFEMAEQMERNGGTFYRSAAENIDDPDHRAMLNKLAAMEDEHEKTFRAMRNELSAKEKASTVFDPQGEAVQYLRALADTRVFFEKQIDVQTMTDTLKAAIEAEKDSIVFYLGMREAVAVDLGKERLDDIIQEEMAHIRLLSKELVALKK